MSDAVHKFRRFGVALMRLHLAEEAHAKQGDAALPELRAAARDVLVVAPKWAELAEAFAELKADVPEDGEAGFLRFLDRTVLLAATPEEIRRLVSSATEGETWN